MVSKEYIAFFKELEKNNHKEWFDKHRKDYEENVRAPFIELVEQVIPALTEMEPSILPDAKKALFRINRDIRFSKDKTPYNTLMKAGLSPGGKKSELPGFYLGIGADYVHVGGGLYQVSKEALSNIRNLIAQNQDEFLSILEQKDFKELFGELQGERNKRIDKQYSELESKVPYIANKQFYVMAKTPSSEFIKNNNQAAFLITYYKTVQPLHFFLNRAFKQSS